MIVIILPLRQIFTVSYGFMATSEMTLKARGLLQMLIFATHFLHQWRFLTHLPYEKNIR